MDKSRINDMVDRKIIEAFKTGVLKDSTYMKHLSNWHLIMIEYQNKNLISKCQP